MLMVVDLTDVSQVRHGCCIREQKDGFINSDATKINSIRVLSYRTVRVHRQTDQVLGTRLHFGERVTVGLTIDENADDPWRVMNGIVKNISPRWN